MTTPKSNPPLAHALFGVASDASPVILEAAAKAVYDAVRIRALAWLVGTVVNFLALLVAPLFLAFTDAHYLFLLIPGLFFGIGFLAVAPTGTLTQRSKKA